MYIELGLYPIIVDTVVAMNDTNYVSVDKNTQKIVIHLSEAVVINKRVGSSYLLTSDLEQKQTVIRDYNEWRNNK